MESEPTVTRWPCSRKKAFAGFLRRPVQSLDEAQRRTASSPPRWLAARMSYVSSHPATAERIARLRRG